MATAAVPALENLPARTTTRPATPQRRAGSWLHDWPWLLALSLLTLLFFLTFFNRFVGMRSGTGEFTTGIWLLQGRLPYRDYFSATPPLNTLKSALLLHLFGPYMIVSRAAGVAERVAIACLLFRWLCRLFPTRFAFAASLVTIIVSAGDRTDPIASYNHDAILWAMLSGFAASHVLDNLRTRPFYAWSATAGIFAGLCMLTKQTIGLGATIAVPIAVAILLFNSGLRTRALTWLTTFAFGWTIPVLAFAVWLQRLHMLKNLRHDGLPQRARCKGSSSRRLPPPRAHGRPEQLVLRHVSPDRHRLDRSLPHPLSVRSTPAESASLKCRLRWPRATLLRCLRPRSSWQQSFLCLRT